MTEERRRRLEAAGYRFTTVREFLGLTSAEMALIDMKVALARALKALRRHRRLTHAQVAKRLGSSQSRVAKMEAGDSSVSMDLLVRSLFALGASKGDLARALETATLTARPTPRRRAAARVASRLTATSRRDREVGSSGHLRPRA